MAELYPIVRTSYLNKRQASGWKLGEVQFVSTNERIVANCATQYNFLPRGVCHADYNAIKVCMTKVKDYARLRNLSIALPKVGAGLAGGDWSLIEQILNDVFSDYDATVYYLD
jgi:O-acetyl-ADP-ribose deacetylase (regulator of RNase III)